MFLFSFQKRFYLEQKNETIGIGTKQNEVWRLRGSGVDVPRLFQKNITAEPGGVGVKHTLLFFKGWFSDRKEHLSLEFCVFSNFFLFFLIGLFQA